MEKARYPIKVMCRVMKVSRSGYYKRNSRSKSRLRIENEKLTDKISDIYKESRRTYGSPRVYNELKKVGIMVGRNRVAKLMREAGLRVKTKRRYRVTIDSKHNYRVFPNILGRRFETSKTNNKWASDMTYIEIQGGWLYLAVVIDLYSRQVVGWAMGRKMRDSLAVTALQMAVGRREIKEGLIHHSDRGSQYASNAYQEELRKHGMVCSMSRKGNCWDNAPLESFFKTLKMDLIYKRKPRSYEATKQEIFEYIEVFYNRRRLHSSLDYVSPVDYELATLVA